MTTDRCIATERDRCRKVTTVHPFRWRDGQPRAHALSCDRVVIEEFLDGPEVSLFAITDGT
ncbi:hypothetical protein AB0935_32950, partial [Streptomyces sp. NPDC007027]|uniref:hypothetical protein n=1 Tax=Streptomyces sp. NPDC007027 TaxID=3157086 RepID=UPI0034517E86